MKGLVKGFIYDVSNLSENQLEELLVWLKINCKLWEGEPIGTLSELGAIIYDFSIGQWVQSYRRKDRVTIDARELFKEGFRHPSFEKLYYKEVERNEKYHYILQEVRELGIMFKKVKKDLS